MIGRVLAVLALALAVLAPLPTPEATARWPSAPSVTALDIGQGDAILLRDPDGAAALVDGGPPGAPPPVLEALRREGVRRLDLVVGTHDASDHLGGLAWVVARMPVAALALPPVRNPSPVVRQLEGAAAAHGVPVREVLAGRSIGVGAWHLQVLWPREELPLGADPNLGCVVLLASAHAFDALLTGDAESPVLGPLPLPSVAVLKVSHHGSDDPGLPDLLRRLRPAVALVSVGADNRYGHPTPSTERALRAAGVPELRTDRCGDVTALARGVVQTVVAQQECAGAG